MNVEKLIKLSLLNNEKVYSQLAKTSEGIPLINALRVPEGKYPLIEFHQISGGDGHSADDEVYTERYTFQVTLVADDELYLDLRGEIKETLRNVGFRVINEYNSKNIHTNKVHYAIHVRQSYDLVWYEREMVRQESIYDDKHPEVNETLPEGIYFDEETGESYEIWDEEDLEGYEILP